MDASVNRILSSTDKKAILIALKLKSELKSENSKSVKNSFEELKQLAVTAGCIILEELIITREFIDSAYIIGKGYLEKLKETIQSLEVKLIVFDLNEIRPAQIRNLEEELKCRVVGRQEIILDIFANRAKTAEAKIQVELAQLKYILPRLKGYGEVLSRLGGGIGTRGPGEKMLETDKRHIQRKIKVLNEKLKKLGQHRKLTRKLRSSKITGSVVGYTNAGKSSLVNLLAKDELFVEDRLFATLDSFTRTVYLSENVSTLLTDTVGFIRNLPANLIEAFSSTLEDITESDYIIHVVDISAEDYEANIKTVNKELQRLNCELKPCIYFFNKCDLVDCDYIVSKILSQYSNAVIGSVYTGVGIDKLKQLIEQLDYGLNQHLSN